MTETRIPIHFLACPECKTSDLEHAEGIAPLAAPYGSAVGIRCSSCRREFPIVDGVHILWTDALRDIHLGTSSGPKSRSDEVIGANVEVYDEIADDYGEHSDNLFNYHDTLLFLKALALDRSTSDRPDGSICLDVGCGPGVGLDAGARFHDFNIGVDVSLANLRHIVRKGHGAVLADSANLPFASDSVDLVTCFAALHHFPSAQDFATDSHRVLRPGAVLLTGADPSDALLRFGPIAQFVWTSRKPVYRFLSRFSDRFYLHRNRDLQSVNDLAENQRTLGGFSVGGLAELLSDAGFNAPSVFCGLDPDGRKRVAVPDVKVGVLKILSFQNPLRPSNWMSLSTISVKLPR